MKEKQKEREIEVIKQINLHTIDIIDSMRKIKLLSSGKTFNQQDLIHGLLLYKDG